MSRGVVARGVCALLALAAATLTSAVPARGIEFFEGRVQVHGSTEMQIRGLASHYSSDDGWDLTQWYNIANLELEFDAAPNGFGPFDSIGAYVRGEARYDCIWKRGCGMFRSVDLVGNRAQRLPRRMSSARRDGFIGVIEPEGFADERPRIAIPLGQNGSVYGPGGLDLPVTGRRTLGRLWNVPGIGELFFAGRGPDLVYATADDPGRYVMQDFLDYRHGRRRRPGSRCPSRSEPRPSKGMRPRVRNRRASPPRRPARRLPACRARRRAAARSVRSRADRAGASSP